MLKGWPKTRVHVPAAAGAKGQLQVRLDLLSSDDYELRVRLQARVSRFGSS